MSEESEQFWPAQPRDAKRCDFVAPIGRNPRAKHGEMTKAMIPTTTAQRAARHGLAKFLSTSCFVPSTRPETARTKLLRLRLSLLPPLSRDDALVWKRDDTFRSRDQRVRFSIACRADFAYNFLYVEGENMKIITYSESRANYAATLDSVLDDREEVIITRAGRDPVVLVALDDYESLKETAYLLRSPANARRLLGSIERLEAGQGVEHDLAE